MGFFETHARKLSLHLAKALSFQSESKVGCVEEFFMKKLFDLVDVVGLLDEHDKFLLFATRSFHSIFVYFFGHKQPGIRAFESPLDSQRGFAPCVDPGES